MLLATLVLGAAGVGLGAIHGLLAIPAVIVWVWVIAFFRDPPRRRAYAVGELCSPADGRVTEISELDHHELIGGPALRVGIFLSLFNVHVNRMPCSGRVHSIKYKKGEFLDARHAESGARNEANTLVIEPDAPLRGPVVVRQVAGKVARRILCHAREGQHWEIGSRFGLIKFGSRTELIIPKQDGTTIFVKVGDQVRGGLTMLVRQAIPPSAAETHNPASARRQHEAAVTIGNR